MTDPDDGATAWAKASCVGPLAIHIEAFAARLGGEGFTSRTVQDKCELVAKLSVWLHRRDLSQDALDEGHSANFTRIVAAQAMCGAAKWQPANNCSDTYVNSVVFGPCRPDLTRPLWTI